MFQNGQQIGPYTLTEKLGRGGFGEVWLAEKRSQFVSKKVAVKLPLAAQVDFEAIKHEATLWEKASGHPNVLPLIDADMYDGQVVIVSEYASGGSLADKLKYGKAPVGIAVEKTVGILSGLAFLHSREIIHRDIKPQNILLQGDTPRLADFGISRAMNTDTISSVVAGTDAYMAPEAFDGKRSAQTDIWSVGVVLYQMLRGSLPYPQQHPTERMFAILTKEFEPLGEEIPAELRAVVRKALAKRAAERYLTADEMNGDLRKVLTGLQSRQTDRTGTAESIGHLPTEAVNAETGGEDGGRQTEQKTEVKDTAPANLRTEVISPQQKSGLPPVGSPAEDESVVTRLPVKDEAARPPARKSRTGFYVGGLLLLLIFGLGATGLGGGAYYYYYYVYLPRIAQGEKSLIGVRPSVEYKVGDIARENIAPPVNISFTDSRGEQISLKRGEIIVKKGELITPEIFEKVSAIYNYNDLSE